MRIEDGRVVRNKRGCGINTVVRGLRAEKAFWDICDKFSAEEGMSRNEFIVRIVSQYCLKKVGASIDKDVTP